MKDRKWQAYITLAKSNASNPVAIGGSPQDTETVISESSGLREVQKIGIGIGIGVGLTAFLAIVGFCLFRKRRRHARLTSGPLAREEMVAKGPAMGDAHEDTRQPAGGVSELDTSNETSSPAPRYTSGHWNQLSNQWDHSHWASTPHTSMDMSQARHWELWQQQAYQQQQRQQELGLEQAHRRSTSDTNTRLSHISTLQPLYEMEQQENPHKLSVPHTGPISAHTWELGPSRKRTGAEVHQSRASGNRPWAGDCKPRAT